MAVFTVRRSLAVLLGGLLAVGVVGAMPAVAADGPTLSIGDQSGLERDTVTGSVFVPIHLSAAAAEPVVVSYWTVDGTAVAGEDYTRWGTPSTPRTITIPAGSLQTQVNVAVLADDVIEGDETFSLVATATGGGVVVSDDTGTATIVDADELSVSNPAIAVSETTVTEGDSGERRAQFLMHLSRPPASSITVTYATVDGSAAAGIDYIAKLPGTVVFAPGQISKTIDVLIGSDTDVDGDRSFALEVAVVGGSPVEELRMTGTATIVDDETQPVPACTPGTFSVDGDEPCTPAPAGTFVAGAGALAPTQCSPGSFQDQPGQTACLPAPIGSYVDTSGATTASLCPEGTTTLAAASASPEDCVSPAAGAVAVSVGYDFSCAVLAGGAVRCWGTNDLGQLGNGTTTSSSLPVPVGGLVGAVDVAAGTTHACALLADGSVRCWGKNDLGQLGDGTLTSSSLPVPVGGLVGVVAITSGNNYSCALLMDGTARCWGANNLGQLGNGTTTNASVPSPVDGLTGAADISAGSGHTCAVLLDGGARCWGPNGSGQLGNGTTNSSTVPVAVFGLSGAVDIAANNSGACAVLGDGTGRCWGGNGSGQLGNGTTGISFNTVVPVTVVGLTGAVGVASGAVAGHVCARLGDGTVRCWGGNSEGKLGNGTTVGASTPVSVSGVTDAVTISAANSNSCAVLVDGSLRCWGSNSVGQLGVGTTADSTQPVAVTGLAGATEIAAGDRYACAVSTAGTASCWGSGATGSSTPVNVPTVVPGLAGAIAVAAGNSLDAHSCAVLTAGTVRCWGYNSSGQLGNGSTTTSTDPVQVSGLTGAVAVAVGGAHSCALLSDGTARCWGNNGSGQLGNGGTAHSRFPVVVSGLTGAVAITAGTGFSCAVLADGSARCWGSKTSGQLGNGSTGGTSTTPVAVFGLTGAVAIAAGATHACARLADGTARCWGANPEGQLGTGSTGGVSNVPVTVSGLTDVVGISAESRHTCAVLSDGAARCWGLNSTGQLGDGTTSSSNVPVAVAGLSDVARISAGAGHSCALLVDGTGRCWGAGIAGQLGDDNAWSTVPVTVLGLG